MRFVSRLSLIVAYTQGNLCIGKSNSLPWVAPIMEQEHNQQTDLRNFMAADLKRFRQLTMGKPIIMGYNTYQSIGRALPGRANLVLSRMHQEVAPGCEIFHNIKAALQRADELNKKKKKEDREVFIVGGAKIYEQLIDKADRMYITVLEKYLPGDTFFPSYDSSKWKPAISRSQKYGTITATFMQLNRKAAV